MITKNLCVLNELGIHARVASKITGCCSNYKSRIEVLKGGRRYNIKNVLGAITLNVKCGGYVEIEIEGDDEEEAAIAIEKLFAEKFGEK